MNVPDEIVGNVFQYLHLEEGTQVRCLSHRFLNLVTNHAWEAPAMHCFNLVKWSKCFPRATTLCYESDDDCVGRFLLPHLKHVRLRLCVVLHASLENVHTLQLHRCLFVSSSTIEHLKHLTFLDVTQCTEFDGDALLGLTKLESLRVSECTQLLDGHFSTLCNLTRLDVDSLQLTGDVCMNKKLKEFSACDTIFFQSFFHHLVGLEKLDLSNTVVSVASFHVCAASLVSLTLDYVSWQGYGIEEMPRLERVSLRGTRFETLRPFRRATWFDLTDAWLDGVRDLRGGLQYLNISLGSYSDHHFLCNLTSVINLVSYKCYLPSKVFDVCPTIEYWSVGCEILKHLDEALLLKKMNVTFMETCHADMCYCDF
jgi:hypothetical protein